MLLIDGYSYRFALRTFLIGIQTPQETQRSEKSGALELGYKGT